MKFIIIINLYAHVFITIYKTHVRENSKIFNFLVFKIITQKSRTMEKFDQIRSLCNFWARISKKLFWNSRSSFLPYRFWSRFLISSLNLIVIGCWEIFRNCSLFTYTSFSQKIVFFNSLLCSLMSSMETVSDFYYLLRQRRSEIFCKLIICRFQGYFQQFTPFLIKILNLKVS